MTDFPDDITVAEYFATAVKKSRISRSKLATCMGFVNVEAVSAIISGDLKMPMTHVLPASIALGIEPMFFFLFVLKEYSPETAQGFEDVFEYTVAQSESHKRGT